MCRWRRNFAVILKSLIQNIPLENKDITLCVKREDLIHPFVSGNKFRKLKYNLLQATSENKTTLLTFGGAFSNHISAVAAAGQALGFKTIGIVRGEELVSKIDGNPTLKWAQQCGMQLEFVSRESYRDKDNPLFLENLKKQFGDFYLLPEGGTNALAVKGCEEILTNEDATFDYICTAVGTGGTISGLINSASQKQMILGFPALKGEFLAAEIQQFTTAKNWQLISGYTFGGYARVDRTLIAFINKFRKENNIPLDPVYTGKMLYGVIDLIEKGYFPSGSKIMAIHTGGLQGIAGMNTILQNKKLPLIDTDD